jgi:hypothetical protein
MSFTIFELEDALVEFFAQNTNTYLFPSNEQTDEMVPPKVWSGYIPRDQVGAVVPGDITTYPAIIVSVRRGVQAFDKDNSVDRELTEVEVLIGTFDKTPDQQGFKDVLNIVQKMKDRLREVSIVRERFPLRMPLKWEVNRFYGGGSSNYFPYFFGEMLLTFETGTFAGNQFDVTTMTGETTPGRYNEFPIPYTTPIRPTPYGH